MKILACVKQVPDSPDTLAIDEGSCWISYMPSTVFRMNRYDEFALEQALFIKERLCGSSVHALSVGPQRASTTVRRAMEMGADHGIHILYSPETYPDPFITASLIATYASTREYDLILTGVMSEDLMDCQTGQLVAALLDVPCATSVIAMEFLHEDHAVIVDREIEGGARISVQMNMPAVLTIQPGINIPRYPSLSNVMRARTQAQETINADELSLPRERETCTGVRLPEPVTMGTFLEGSPREKARELLSILRDKALIP